MLNLILDFDGVIGDTEEMNLAVIQDLHPDTDHNAIVEHHMGNVYESTKIPFTTASTEAYFRMYGKRLMVQHVERALPHLHALNGMGYQLHIVTSNCEQAIWKVLMKADVAHAFQYILGKGAHTSKVVKLTRLLALLKIKPYETVFITDTAGDILEARTVGIPTLAVTFGYHSREILAPLNPTYLVDSWDAIIEKVCDGCN